MKRAFLSVLCLLFLATASAQAQIANSGHDFSSEAWAGATTGGGGDVCAPCHTPHTTSTASPEVPLWNHDLTGTGYTMYTSTTLDGTVDANPSGSTAACLGCHDGVVALDSYGGVTGSTVLTESGDHGTKTLMGKDLRNEHPVSINYQSAIDNGETNLNAATGAVADLLRGGKVHCNSCHDPHNQGFTASTITRTGYTWKFLRVDNAASAMCTTCHDL